MIKGLPNTNQNYAVAVNLLPERYGDEVKQTHVLLQKFHNLPSPKHNAKDLRSFLTVYRKVREQMRCVTNIHESELVIRSTLIRKLSMQTYEAICDYRRNYNFSLMQMDVATQYIVDKFKHATLAMGEKTNVKSVEVKSSQQKQKGGQLTFAYCAGNHKAIDCTKYKTINARKDRIIAQHLCFNCLGGGHSSKTCKSTRTCRICHFHHYTSLCNQQSDGNSKSNDLSSNGKSQSSQSHSSSNAQSQSQSHPYPTQQQQQQQTHQQNPIVAQRKSNTPNKTPSSSVQQTSVTNVNLA